MNYLQLKYHPCILTLATKQNNIITKNKVLTNMKPELHGEGKKPQQNRKLVLKNIV